MTDCMEREAVKKLLSEDKPEGYIATLDEMFEAWLCSPHCDGTTGDQRSIALTQIKALKRFMKSLR